MRLISTAESDSSPSITTYFFVVCVWVGGWVSNMNPRSSLHAGIEACLGERWALDRRDRVTQKDKDESRTADRPARM